MTTLLATIFVFGLIVFIHELGHFLAAKACKMRVEEFAIGVGPTVIKHRRGETVYSIRALPLGGFNRIAGMSPDEPLDEYSFLSKPVWQRFIVISAGAVFNFLLAIVLFFLVFAVSGVQTPLDEPVVGKLVNNGPAAAAHMQTGDRIIAIAGQKVEKWQDISPALKGKQNQVTDIVVERNGERLEVSAIPMDSGNGRAVIGINPTYESKLLPVDKAAQDAVIGTGTIIYSMVHDLWKMISGEEKAQVAGPIGVAQLAGQVAEAGFSYLVNFTAVLSINLGVLNLLPIPALDGGHLIMLLYEGITRRKLPPKALYYIQMTGLAIMFLIFIYATSHDISRL